MFLSSYLDKVQGVENCETAMTEPTPFYKRTLDSFADHIITKAHPRNDGGWHAVLDCSFKTYVSDPDFATHGYGKDVAEAHARGAKGIRNDAKGIGKFAPHSILKDGYDLHWRLMKHWDRKERLEAAGLDPNEVTLAAEKADWAFWALDGEWLNRHEATRTIEFVYLLAVAETGVGVRNGEFDIERAKEVILDAVKAEFADVGFRCRPTTETWSNLHQRIDDAVMNLNSEIGGPNI